MSQSLFPSAMLCFVWFCSAKRLMKVREKAILTKLNSCKDFGQGIKILELLNVSEEEHRWHQLIQNALSTESLIIERVCAPFRGLDLMMHWSIPTTEEVECRITI